MILLRNSCSQNPHQQVLKSKADQLLSSALKTNVVHGIALLSQTVVFCLPQTFRDIEHPPIQPKNFYTYHYFIYLNLLLENSCQTTSKHRAQIFFWQRQNTLQLFFCLRKRAWALVEQRCKAVATCGVSLCKNAFLPPHKPGALQGWGTGEGTR